MNRTDIIAEYVQAVVKQLSSGHAKEHAYRPALERLMSSFEDVIAVNDPKRSEHGNPDMVFLKDSNRSIILGYAEAKDIDISLDKTEKTNQMHRYSGYDNLYLTNYLEFRFYLNGEKQSTIEIGKLKDGAIELLPQNYSMLADELDNFITSQPESIRSGKRLALIMGAKARRLRDRVNRKFADEDMRSDELNKIFNVMKQLLVHDLTVEKFADMYAQTLVYGLFVARYGDESKESFSREEARELVPASNPFLKDFFDHIAGSRFDKDLAQIVNELCEVFQASDVNILVHKHLKLFELDDGDDKDPIIHFYEDFLKEYDANERKKMGAYYTPVPVVRFIVRQVDKILKEEFGLLKGLADTSKKPVTITTQGTKHKVDLHQVQILDPAVGTATFLNETIKHIRKDFEGQEGRWESYVNEDLLPRLHGFELMMAPYTIAHLKLGMTLQETGVKDISKRIGVYLTNTLEEGTKRQNDLLAGLGLAETISHEAEEAGKIKHERPIMVIMGNPPYSVSSNNKSEWIQGLIKDYKKDLIEKKINLDDDYIKFIRFAEEMISKNGQGIVAMITNNSYLDGITHRQMRKHLLNTFDKIYILDLHGNSKKKEVTPDGGKDENVFAIMQGVSIIVAVKTSTAKDRGSAYFYEMFGSRSKKFTSLGKSLEFVKIEPTPPNYFLVPKDFKLQQEYEKHLSLDQLLTANVSGVESVRDSIAIQFDKFSLKKVVEDFLSLDESAIAKKYATEDARDWKISRAKNDVKLNFNKPNVWQSIAYRPFDIRQTFYSGKQNGFVCNGRYNIMKHMTQRNIGLVIKRGIDEPSTALGFVSENIIDRRYWSRPGMQGAEQIYPLYVYNEDGSRIANFAIAVLKKFTKNLREEYKPEDILDYIYAVLHSPNYREKYKEFFKIDFPRVPIPKNDEEFVSLKKFGTELRESHLMKSTDLNEYITTFPESGSDKVEKVKYEEGKVWINDQQYFGNVPEIAWNFYIGGYQPAQKWLKDRKGRVLNNNDIDHYQKIIKILHETNRIMLEIDNCRF